MGDGQGGRMTQPEEDSTPSEVRSWEAEGELTEVVRQCWPVVVERFVSAMGGTSLSAANLASPEIARRSPVTLEDFIATVLTVDDPAQSELAHTEPPGKLDVVALLAKFAMFRQIILDEIPKGYGRHLDSKETSSLNQAVDSLLAGKIMAAVGRQQQESKQAGEAQSKSLGVFDHDIRGNLQAMLLTVQVLQRQRWGEESKEDMDRLHRLILQTMEKLATMFPAQKAINRPSP
jgi:hypothetical protein